MSETSDLRSLAKTAGVDYKTFYRGANFRDAVLKGQDLSEFDLSGAQHNNPLELFLLKPSDEKVDDVSSDARLVRLNITINEAIHHWLRRRNRGIMNAHVDRIINCFIRDHLRFYSESGARGSINLEQEIMRNFEEQIGMNSSRRSPVAYSVNYSTRERIYRVSTLLGATNAEFVRVAIYWVLLFDKVRGLKQQA
jgi:hypothetical protein